MIRTFTAALAACAAFIAGPAYADTLIENVEGVTIGKDGELERFTGLVIDNDGRIRSVLKSGEERPRDIDFQEDGGGKVMLPGMIDAHLHVMGLGLGALTLDLSETNSIEEALAAIKTFADENPSRPWILGRGWNQEKWGLGRFPTAAELDAVVADRPVYLGRVDGHAGWANSLAMKSAGVDASSTSPSGGRIIRQAGSKAPSGVFVDAAEQLVLSAIPAPRAATRDLAFQEAQKLLHSYGVTAAADMGTSAQDWNTFRRAGDNGALTLRIMAYATDVDTMAQVAGPRPTRWLYSDKLRMNGVKLYLDGALGSRGAVLKQPYADEPDNKGLPLLSSAQLRNLMSRAALNNFQLAVHAIGDGANADILSAIEGLSSSYTGDRRWRVEHAQIVDPADIAAFGKHGIIASMQPVHQTSDRLMAEARLGPDRLGGAYAWRSISAAGAKLAFGSDAPVERPDPWAGLAVAISRTDAKGEPFGGWRATEVVSRTAALAGFTSDAAYAGFGEGRFGRLIAGERADFVLVDRDPFLASPQDIRATKVLQTWVGGRKVYDSADQN
ncbi:MAG: amidohydrolase family protein [Erythrobacter sp.]